MTWKPTSESLPDGRPIWKCADCGRRTWGHNPVPHGCTNRRSFSEVNQLPACRHLGGQIGEVGCGCGDRERQVPVYVCRAGLGPCTERSTNKPGLRFGGEKVVVCLGCPSFCQTAPENATIQK